MQFEIQIIKWLQSFSTAFLDGFFKVTSYLFDYPAMILLALIFILFYKKEYGVYFLLVELIAALLQYVLKCIIARPRPYLVSEEIINMLQAMGHSFPSGHSVTAFGMALFVGYIVFKSDKKTWQKVLCYVGLVLFVLFSGINRMYLGQHYLTDLFGGYAFMFIICVIAYYLYPYYLKLWAKIFKKDIPKAKE